MDPGSLLNAGQYVTLSKDVIMLPRYPAKKYDVRRLRIAARRCIPIVCKHRPTRTMTARLTH